MKLSNSSGVTNLLREREKMIQYKRFSSRQDETQRSNTGTKKKNLSKCNDLCNLQFALWFSSQMVTGQILHPIHLQVV